MTFTRRQLKEVVLCLDYAKNYNHGTGGHNGYELGALLARTSESAIVNKLVEVFDAEIYHNSNDIVAKAIEYAPEEFWEEKKNAH